MGKQSSPRQVFLACLVCGLALLLFIYDFFIQVAPSVMTHQLMRELDIDAGGLGMPSACFYCAYGLMQVPAGMLLNRLGARKLLFIGAVINTVGILLFAHANHLLTAGIARFLIGFGSSSTFVGNLYVTAHPYFR